MYQARPIHAVFVPAILNHLYRLCMYLIYRACKYRPEQVHRLKCNCLINLLVLTFFMLPDSQLTRRVFMYILLVGELEDHSILVLSGI